MTSNDEQIDLLMRRHARSAKHTTTTDHLDADEMNTFAEGALPPVARARYVSHLADCDQCRQQVAQLALSAGAVVRTEQSVPEKPAPRSVWQVFGGWFALPVLRYAAFAAALLIVAGVAFIALRPRSDGSLVAGNGPREQHPASAVKSSAPDSNANSQVKAAQALASPATTGAASDQNPKRDETRVAENISPPQPPAKEAPLPSASIESKAGESQAYKMSPSYAPPPPGESQARLREQESVSGTLSVQKKADATDKIAAADRERDATKDAGRADQGIRTMTANQPVPANRRAMEEKQKGPSRNAENLSINRTQNEVRDEQKKTEGTAAGKPASAEESYQTRSAGGHKFRRQGNSWVDQKFKSSMAMKSISRGSDEFKALDSGVRSIAQQISGEVIIVWKGKAYLIR